jgi:hypothetical protein
MEKGTDPSRMDEINMEIAKDAASVCYVHNLLGDLCGM